MNTKTEVEIVEPEISESIQAGYDRIANPEKVKEDENSENASKLSVSATVETAASSDVGGTPAFTNDQIQEVMATLARIPKLEKQLNDTGGRYGALRQSLDQLQQRMSAPTAGDPADVEEMLKDIKEEFGEEGLYTSLKSAFSKVAAGRQFDPSAVDKIVSEKIAEAKQEELREAIEQLSESHPTWMQDRETPEFAEWKKTLPDKVLKRFNRSVDPDYLSDKLDEFNEWKTKKSVPATPQPQQKPAPVPSKRLTNAVLPTNGTKPKAAGAEDKASSIRAGYERVAGARMR